MAAVRTVVAYGSLYPSDVSEDDGVATQADAEQAYKQAIVDFGVK